MNFTDALIEELSLPRGGEGDDLNETHTMTLYALFRNALKRTRFKTMAVHTILDGVQATVHENGTPHIYTITVTVKDARIK